MNRIPHIGIACALMLGGVLCAGQAGTGLERQRQTAFALEQQGNNAAAEAAWRDYLKMRPRSAEAYAHLGLLEARQEHYKEAIPLYRKALALDPAFPQLRFNLGLALFKGGDLHGALAEFEPLLKAAPAGSPLAERLNILLGMAHYGLSEHAAAVPYLKAAAAADPQNLAIRLSLAHSCLWSKQYACVLDTYHEILLLDAQSAEADMIAGEAADELKDHLGAIQHFRDAVKANPSEPEVHFGLGYLLWTQHQIEEAARELQIELSHDPNHSQALLYLGDCEMQMEHPEAALPLLEKSIRIEPRLELAHLDLGILYADLGRNKDALAEMQTAARLAPDDVNVHWRLGRLYRTMGKVDEAKVELDKAKNITKAADTDLVNKMSPDARPPASKAGAASPAER